MLVGLQRDLAMEVGPVAFANLSDVFYVDEGTVVCADREIVERGYLGGAAVQFDDELAVAEPGCSCREDEVLLIDG